MEADLFNALIEDSVRLLKTPIIGPMAKTVASSTMDMVAGLVRRVDPERAATDLLRQDGAADSHAGRKPND